MKISVEVAHKEVDPATVYFNSWMLDQYFNAKSKQEKTF
jgi:hypothetical protein